jgi:hypothetical protein
LHSPEFTIEFPNPDIDFGGFPVALPVSAQVRLGKSLAQGWTPSCQSFQFTFFAQVQRGKPPAQEEHKNHYRNNIIFADMFQNILK